jgi:RHS repeat-associated protein
MPGRQYTGATGYRYGFNGKENDNEVKNIQGSQQDYGMRIYDPRLGKFLSLDPLMKDFPYYTPYQFSGNMPICAIDIDGLEAIYYGNAFKNFGNKIMLKLFGATGLKKQVEEQFAKNNSKYDLYIVVVRTKDQGGVIRNNNGDIEDLGTMESTYELKSTNKDFKEKYEMLKKQGLDPMQTIKNGKTPIIMEVSDDFAKVYEEKGLTNKDRKLGLASLKVGIFTLFHGFFHANKQVEGINKDKLGRDDHQQLYGDAYDSPSYDWYGSSPHYSDIDADPSSPAYNAKEKIETTVDKLEEQ